jgi:2,5-dihydroxypyridine 5,6-dioxygenase
MEIRPDVFKGAYRLVTESAKLEQGEDVLIVTDTASTKYAEAIMAAALSITKHVDIIVMPLYGRLHGQNPSDAVAKAMKTVDVVFMPTVWSMSHCTARRDASRLGVRCYTIPSADDELFARTMVDTPYGDLKEVVMTVNQMLTEAKEAEVTTKAGTELWFNLEGRYNIDLEHGWLHKGQDEYADNFSAPPCVEANIAPIEGTTQGKIVVDAAHSAVGAVSDPIYLNVEDGRIISVDGGKEAAALQMRLDEVQDDDIYQVAELGIGLNPKARLRGQFIEDESIFGTGHVGHGNNESTMGGTITCNGHFDNIFWYPTIKLDGKIIFEEGRIVSNDLPKMTGYYVK